MTRTKLLLLFVLCWTVTVQAKEPVVEFKQQKITIKDVPLTVEVADTPEKTARGLMFRKELAENHGMLFIFDGLEIRNFWMKNTFIPLSIGFFDDRRVLVDIQDMDPVKSEMDQSPPSYTSRKPAKYCLEVRRGWFGKHKIKVGDRFDFLK